jgi:hypothetical protein
MAHPLIGYRQMLQLGQLPTRKPWHWLFCSTMNGWMAAAIRAGKRKRAGDCRSDHRRG